MKEKLIKLKSLLAGFFNTFIGYFNFGQAVDVAVNEEKELLEQVKLAHRDWEIALNNFNYCLDNDFIDYSIYNIEAAEKKYVYLVKRARKENIKVNDGMSQKISIYQEP